MTNFNLFNFNFSLRTEAEILNVRSRNIMAHKCWWQTECSRKKQSLTAICDQVPFPITVLQISHFCPPQGDSRSVFCVKGQRVRAQLDTFWFHWQQQQNNSQLQTDLAEQPHRRAFIRKLQGAARPARAGFAPLPLKDPIESGLPGKMKHCASTHPPHLQGWRGPRGPLIPAQGPLASWLLCWCAVRLKNITSRNGRSPRYCQIIMLKQSCVNSKTLG